MSKYIRWNDYEMTKLDLLHKQMEMEFIWSNKFMKDNNTKMYLLCQNDINNIKTQIALIKESKQKAFSKKVNNNNLN
jgi:hypothetical protein